MITVEARDELGIFWLPEDPESKVSGRLTYTPTGGADVSLVGTLRNHPLGGVDAASKHIRIIGIIGGTTVTLDDCIPSSSAAYAAGVVCSSYHANYMYVGHDFGSAEPMFQSVEVDLHGLNDWVMQSALKETYHYRRASNDPSDTPIAPHEELAFKSYEVHAEIPKSQVATFSRGSIKIRFSYRHSGDPVSGIQLSSKPTLIIEYASPQSMKEIHRDVGHLQNLLVLCVDSRTYVDSLTLRDPEIRHEVPPGREDNRLRRIEFLAEYREYIEPSARKKIRQHDMLLTFDDLGGLPTLALWLDMPARLDPAINSLISVKSTEYIYGQNRFLNVAYAAEAFHRVTRSSETQMPDEEFRRLYQAFLDITPVEQHEWLEDKFLHGNRTTFSKRLRELVQFTDPAGPTLVGGNRNWPYVVTQVRNELTHLGDRYDLIEGDDLYWLAESVYVLVCIGLLREVGIGDDAMRTISDSQAVLWRKSYVARATESAYQRLRAKPTPSTAPTTASESGTPETPPDVTAQANG